MACVIWNDFLFKLCAKRRVLHFLHKYRQLDNETSWWIALLIVQARSMECGDSCPNKTFWWYAPVLPAFFSLFPNQWWLSSASSRFMDSQPYSISVFAFPSCWPAVSVKRRLSLAWKRQLKKTALTSEALCRSVILSVCTCAYMYYINTGAHILNGSTSPTLSFSKKSIRTYIYIQLYVYAHTEKVKEGGEKETYTCYACRHMYMNINTKPDTQQCGSEWDPLYRTDIRKKTSMNAEWVKRKQKLILSKVLSF